MTVPRIQGWAANDPYRSHTGPSSASANSSRPLHRSTSTSSAPTKRPSVIVPVDPPPPPRPENGTTAIVAPRRSSSSHTACGATKSRHPGGSRAVCGWEARRPDGVRHASPDSTLHVGHGRSRHPRATRILCVGLARLQNSNRSRRQREPGAARQSGHHSANHARRSLTGSYRLAEPRCHRYRVPAAILMHPSCTLNLLATAFRRLGPRRKAACFQGFRLSGRSRTRTWDLFLIREAL